MPARAWPSELSTETVNAPASWVGASRKTSAVSAVLKSMESFSVLKPFKGLA